MNYNSGAMDELLRIVVSGRVQGVGFRYFTETAARNHGASGWVRNRPDGAVEILASLPGSQKSRFLEAIRRGPPASRVTNLDVRAATPDSDFSEGSFTVRY